MAPNKILDLLMVQLGNLSDATVRGNILLEMNLQQDVLEGGPFKPWFLISTEQQLNVVANTRDILLPTGFLHEVDELKLFIIDSDGAYQPMTKKEYYQLEDEWGLAATGELPREYAIVGKYLVPFPLPLVSTTIRGRFYMRQPDLVDGIDDNDWSAEAPDLLIAATGEAVAQKHLQNPELGAVFAPGKTQAWQRLQIENTARMEAAIMRSMG